MNVDMKKYKLLIYIASGFALLCLALLFWFFSGSFLRLSVTPKDAIVTIDNSPIYLTKTGKANKKVKKGAHILRVEKEGYIAFSQDLVSKAGSIKSLAITLKNLPQALDSGGQLAKGNDLSDGYFLSSDGRAIYKASVGFDDSGNVVNLANNEITPAKLSGIQDIIWSPHKDFALFRKTDAIYLYDFKKYDFVNQTESIYGKNIGSIAWSPDNSKIAYFYNPPSGEKTLIFSNFNNTNAERVYNFAGTTIENPTLRWSPDSQWLLIAPQGKNYTENNLYVFNAYTRTIRKITDTGNQVDGLFSPDSKSVVYATYSADPGQPIPYVLSIMNVDGSNKRSLDIRADIRKGVWFKDSNKLLLVSYDTQAKRDYIFKFDIAKKEKSYSISNSTQGQINSVVLANDDQIILYQSNSQIFGIRANLLN